jgi:hypothetical protein
MTTSGPTNRSKRPETTAKYRSGDQKDEVPKAENLGRGNALKITQV